MSFVNETPVKATRSRKTCDICRTPIEVGEPAIRWVGMSDGDFYYCSYHPECRAAEIAFNAMADRSSDEWYSLGVDRDPEDDGWLLAEHPIVAARMGIKESQL